MQSRTVSVRDIKVINRIRQEFGDIGSLARDIKENGLINPITVTPELKLVAGERRLRAVKSLGWEEVDVRVVEDADDMKQMWMEISENDNRQDFTFSERQKIKNMLCEIFEAEAKKRQISGLKHVGDPSLASHDANEKVSKKIGDMLGVSSTTIERADYVADHATPEMIAALDAKQLSINAAYKQLREQAKKAEQEKKNLQKEKEKLQSDLEEARADAKREKAAKNQLEREEDAASEKMEQLQQKVWELEGLLEDAKEQPVHTEEYDALLKKYERATTLLKQNTETMLETEKMLDAMRNSSGIRRAGLVVEVCEKIANLSFELEEFDQEDFVEMDPMTRAEIRTTATNTINALENLRSIVNGAERRTA